MPCVNSNTVFLRRYTAFFDFQVRRQLAGTAVYFHFLQNTLAYQMALCYI